MLMTSYRKPQRQRHVRPVLEKPSFDWDSQDRYVKLMNFEMKVMNILETRVYEITDEEKVPLIEHW